jgi:hypothetical protein
MQAGGKDIMLTLLFPCRGGCAKRRAKNWPPPLCIERDEQARRIENREKFDRGTAADQTCTTSCLLEMLVPSSGCTAFAKIFHPSDKRLPSQIMLPRPLPQSGPTGGKCGISCLCAARFALRFGRHAPGQSRARPTSPIRYRNLWW